MTSVLPSATLEPVQFCNRTMVRWVVDDAGHDRVVDNLVGHVLNGVTGPILERTSKYWRNVDKERGDRR
jgi:catalase